MRRTGWLLLVGSLALTVAVGLVYQQRKADQDKAAPQKPATLPSGMQALADSGWFWRKTEGDRTLAELRAKQFTQQMDPPRVDVEGVEIKIFHKNDPGFDIVKSAKGVLRTEEGTFYSEGEVEMTMGLREEPNAHNRLVNIKTSGVTYSTQTGRVLTERPAEFVFENSRGSATGASYDPVTRELLMQRDVRVEWTKNKRTMRVEAGELTYKELESKIYLKPWSRLTRDTLTLNAAASVVTLNEGEIQLVEAENAKGEDRPPKRALDYAADRLVLRFAEKNTINRVEGENNAKLVALSPSGKTTVTAHRVDMDFDARDGDSILKKAVANGNTRVESEPLQSATRVMKSETVEMAMRPGGEEIATVVTHTPGEIEFHPKTPADRYRKLTGDRFWIDYGAQNQIEKFRATKASTFSKGRQKQPDAHTTSEELLALFDPKTGDMASLEQWNQFQYDAGDRKARADRARLDQPTGRITLQGKARMWDSTGSTDAAAIDLDQNTGDMVATGKVISTRLPDKKQAKPKSSLVDSSETIQARAEKMTTRDDNKWIRYEGGATMWQGADKLDAEMITIDRKNQVLAASGKVVSQTRERPKAGAKDVKGQMFTLVRAPEMTYRETEKEAYYRGGVTMDRGDLTVKSRELRAWFSKDDPATPDNEGNSLQRARADGNVDIVQGDSTRTRKGVSEQADYEITDGKVTLTGGSPVFTDSLKGTTRGQKITWFADNEKLQVEGATAQPTESRLKRKKASQ